MNGVPIIYRLLFFTATSNTDISSNTDVSRGEAPYLRGLAEGRHRKNTTVKYENAQRIDT